MSHIRKLISNIEDMQRDIIVLRNRSDDKDWVWRACNILQGKLEDAHAEARKVKNELNK